MCVCAHAHMHNHDATEECIGISWIEIQFLFACWDIPTSGKFGAPTEFLLKSSPQTSLIFILNHLETVQNGAER